MAHVFYGPDGSALSKPEDVIPFLGRQEKHWHRERSAYQAAHSWFLSNGLPAPVRDILRTDPAFENAALTKVFFERKTKLDPHGRESQTDVLAIVSTDGGPAVLGIEAKVDESFGPLIEEWNDYSPGKLRRLAGLLERLELRSDAIGLLRYQLLHRTAATLIEAEEAGASRAVMLVQSFDRNRAGFSDFVAFAKAFGTPVEAPGELSPAKILGRVTIRLGWTENRKLYPEG